MKRTATLDTANVETRVEEPGFGRHLLGTSPMVTVNGKDEEIYPGLDAIEAALIGGKNLKAPGVSPQMQSLDDSFAEPDDGPGTEIPPSRSLHVEPDPVLKWDDTRLRLTPGAAQLLQGEKSMPEHEAPVHAEDSFSELPPEPHVDAIGYLAQHQATPSRKRWSPLLLWAALLTATVAVGVFAYVEMKRLHNTQPSTNVVPVREASSQAASPSTAATEDPMPYAKMLRDKMKEQIAPTVKEVQDLSEKVGRLEQENRSLRQALDNIKTNSSGGKFPSADAMRRAWDQLDAEERARQKPQTRPLLPEEKRIEGAAG